MSIWVILLAISLGLDVFAGGLALGIANLPRPQWMWTAVVFAFAGVVLLTIGVVVGRLLNDNHGHFASYLAGAALLIIGLRGVISAFFG
jgi:putative Mn2+ efflux pump MntP